MIGQNGKMLEGDDPGEEPTGSVSIIQPRTDVIDHTSMNEQG